MVKIKTLLRLLGAVSLTTVTASSVVACGGNNNDNTKIWNKVSQNLKLTDINGKGLISPTINVDATDKSKVTWKIDLSSIKVESLVQTNKKAKDKESFDFLKNVLKIKIDSGTKLEDAIFNDAQLKAATITFSDINVNLKSIKLKTDFYVENGSYNIMFTNGATKTDKYKIVTKLGSENDITGVVGDNVINLVREDFNQNFQNKFKDGESVSEFQEGSDLTKYLDNTKDYFKTNSGIAKLINIIDLKVEVTRNDTKTGNFPKGSSMVVSTLIGNVKLKSVTLYVNE